MAATMVTPKATNWTAPEDWYRQVAAALPDWWLVNAGGEVVDRDPLEIADHVLAGGAWVDYCGYPMYYREDGKEYWWLHPYFRDIFGPFVRQGTLGFSRFLMRLNMLFDHTFMADKAGFEFPRSLVVDTDKVPPFVVPDTKAPHADRVFSCFALRHESGGWYFYAYAHPSGEGVSPREYIRFINSLTRPEIELPGPPLQPEALLWWLVPSALLLTGAGLIISSTRRGR